MTRRAKIAEARREAAKAKRLGFEETAKEWLMVSYMLQKEEKK